MDPPGPYGAHSPDHVRAKLNVQRDECLSILSQIQHGEGSLHQVRMSVQNLGKLDMYQWLYFIVQHAKRHVIEMERIYQQAQISQDR